VVNTNRGSANALRLRTQCTPQRGARGRRRSCAAVKVHDGRGGARPAIVAPRRASIVWGMRVSTLRTVRTSPSTGVSQRRRRVRLVGERSEPGGVPAIERSFSTRCFTTPLRSPGDAREGLQVDLRRLLRFRRRERAGQRCARCGPPQSTSEPGHALPEASTSSTVSRCTSRPTGGRGATFRDRTMLPIGRLESARGRAAASAARKAAAAGGRTDVGQLPGPRLQRHDVGGVARRRAG